GLGRHVEAPMTPFQRSATAPPGRCERLGFGAPCRGPHDAVPEKRHGSAGALRTLGVWGPFRGPYDADHSREAPRLGQGASNVGGFGGHFVAPMTLTVSEKRHGSAGALRTSG